MRALRLLGVPGCVLAAGCASRPVAQIPDSLFLDVAASASWKATHCVYASWDGREVELPACIRFQRVPNVITHAIHHENGRVEAQWGSMRIAIVSRPEAGMIPLSPGRDSVALADARIRYWVFAPLSESTPGAEQEAPPPEELLARMASGQVRVVVLP